MRALPVVLVAVLALGAAAFLLLPRDGGGFLGFGGSAEREEQTEEERALLEGSPSLQGSTGGRPRRPEPMEPIVPTPAPSATGSLRVKVVDDLTGRPVSGARIELQLAGQPCPRISTRLTDLDWTDPVRKLVALNSVGQRETTDGDGALEVNLSVGLGGKVDVFVGAAGYVHGVACAVSVPGEATVRLVKGLSLQGRVSDRQGKHLEGAEVRVEPGAGTPATPGHRARTRAADEGRFLLEGLLAGALRVTVHRDGFWPLTVENEDPSDPRERTYVLDPAFALKFRLRADDGRDLTSPTVQATAATRPPFSLVRILEFTDDTTNDGRLTVGVPVPATLGRVSLEVKAEGYAAWRLPDVAVPPEGGEQTFLIELERDTGQGGARFVFEDERGQILKYGALNALPPTVQPLERQDLSGGIVYEVQDDLRFPSLPAGRYRMGVAAFAYAPTTAEVVVLGGSEAEVRVPLRVAGKMRVRFLAPSARTVKFRVTQNGRPVPALLEKAPPRDPAKPDEDPVLTSGEEGALLGGLASGSYVVEVLSEDLQASRTPVSVREGETEEVEIRVQPR